MSVFPFREAETLLLAVYLYSLSPTVWRNDPAVLEAYLSGTVTKTVCRERELQAPVYGKKRSCPSEGHMGEAKDAVTALRTLAAPPRTTLHI